MNIYIHMRIRQEPTGFINLVNLFAWDIVQSIPYTIIGGEND